MGPTRSGSAERPHQSWLQAPGLACRLPGREATHHLAQMYLATFARFLLVGLSGVFVNMGTLWFLTEVGGLYYMVSSVVAVEVSIVTNFLMNNSWTFRHRSHGVFRLSALAKYNLVCGGGIVGSTTILYLLTTLGGIHYLLANLAAISVTALWNFAANTAWTWRQQSPKGGDRAADITVSDH